MLDSSSLFKIIPDSITFSQYSIRKSLLFSYSFQTRRKFIYSYKKQPFLDSQEQDGCFSFFMLKSQQILL